MTDIHWETERERDIGRQKGRETCRERDSGWDTQTEIEERQR